AGRKPNGRMQTCQEALHASAERIASFMNSGKVGAALHVAQDWGTPSHGGLPWLGGFPDGDHLMGDWFRNGAALVNRIANGVWIINHLPRKGEVVTGGKVYPNMRGGLCQ